MTVQEALSQGISVTGVGLAIVFSVLIILMLVMVVMKKVFYKEQTVKAVVEAEPKMEQTGEEDADELIAVLTAAIAASLNTSTYNLKIKSYKRVGSSAPAWNKAGVEETIASRF